MSTTNQPVLAVLCDVGPRYGVGHLMRCVALAEEFAARGYRVVFVSDADQVPFAARQLQTRGFGAQRPPAGPGAASYVAQLDALGASAVVIDSYHLPDEVYAEVSAAYPTVALTDGDPGGRIAHLYVDQNLGAEDDHWDLPQGAVRLAGLDYALMREEVLAQRPATDEHAEHDPVRVLAFFGGTDAFGAGPVLTRALVATGLPFELRVVAPTAWEQPVQPGPGQRIEVIAPTERLAAEVLAADLVVSAAGTSSWELLCLGAACAFVCVADNQELSYGRAVATGIGVGLGRLEEIAADPSRAAEELARVLGSTQLRAELRARGRRLVDGDGRVRVLEAFEQFRRRRPQRLI